MLTETETGFNHRQRVRGARTYVVQRNVHDLHRRGGRGRLLEEGNAAADGRNREMEPALCSGGEHRRVDSFMNTITFCIFLKNRKNSPRQTTASPATTWIIFHFTFTKQNFYYSIHDFCDRFPYTVNWRENGTIFRFLYNNGNPVYTLFCLMVNQTSKERPKLEAHADLFSHPSSTDSVCL